ncbi:MAG: riboflavin kinase [Alphaproteobacteria bacterium]|nr:riboflavin kinase [Alphaproteobacteria bacterium]
MKPLYFSIARTAVFSWMVLAGAFVSAMDVNVSVQGYVIEGQKEARTLGCPTANIEFNPQDILLLSGVYAACTTVAMETVNAIAYYNKDWRPTILESHLFDWNKDLYGQNVTITLRHLIRPSIDFSVLMPEEITRQIHSDMQTVKEWHEKRG